MYIICTFVHVHVYIIYTFVVLFWSHHKIYSHSDATKFDINDRKYLELLLLYIHIQNKCQLCERKTNPKQNKLSNNNLFQSNKINTY